MRVPKPSLKIRASWNSALRSFPPEFKPVIAHSGEIVTRSQLSTLNPQLPAPLPITLKPSVQAA